MITNNAMYAIIIYYINKTNQLDSVQNKLKSFFPGAPLYSQSQTKIIIIVLKIILFPSKSIPALALLESIPSVINPSKKHKF